MNEYAVFYQKENGDYKQLGVWMKLNEAKNLVDNKAYFNNLDKIIFKRV